MKDKFATFLSKIILILQKPEMGILPGHLAFFFVMSIIPLITLIVFFGSFLNIPTSDLLEFFNTALPKGVGNILVPAFTESTINFGTVALVIITFFIASNGANSVITTSNTLYNIKGDDLIRRRVKSIVLTVIIIGLLLFMFLIPIFGEYVIDIIGNFFKGNKVHDTLHLIYSIIKIPISLIYIYLNIKLIYTLSPDKDVKSSDATNGAIFTTISWVVVTQIYSYYIANFSNYSRVYGNLSNIIVLMLYLYLLAYVFVVGMAFNASRKELDEEIEKTGKINIIKGVHNK